MVQAPYEILTLKFLMSPRRLVRGHQNVNVNE